MDVWRIATWVIEFGVGYLGLCATLYALEMVLGTINAGGLVKQYMGPLYGLVQPGMAGAKTLVELIMKNFGTTS